VIRETIREVATQRDDPTERTDSDPSSFPSSNLPAKAVDNRGTRADWAMNAAFLNEIGSAVAVSAETVTAIPDRPLCKASLLPYINPDGVDTILHVHEYDPELLCRVEQIVLWTARVVDWALPVLGRTTRYAKHRAIVPHIPALQRLRSRLIELRPAVDPEPKLPNGSFIPKLNEEVLWPHPYPLELARGCIAMAIEGLAEVEERIGNFNIRIERPRLSTCDALARALEQHEPDAEDFLEWFLRAELKCNPRLASYVALLLCHIPEISTCPPVPLAEKDEDELYAWLRDRSAANHNRDERRSHFPKLGGKDVVSLNDPLSVLSRIGKRVRLCDLAVQWTSCPTPDRVRDLVVQLGFSEDERAYIKVKKFAGYTQEQARTLLGWSLAKFARVRRSADRKLKLHYSAGEMFNKF
jgi:hypothetical protein